MNAAPKFTPGPWCPHPAGANVRVGASVTDLGGKPIASCRVYPKTHAARAEANANACLIAAAPDLYVVLQAVADYWAGGDVPEDIDRLMRAALAKARGEA